MLKDLPGRESRQMLVWLLRHFISRRWQRGKLRGNIPRRAIEAIDLILDCIMKVDTGRQVVRKKV